MRSHCPISSTLDIVGDKWSLLIVRDILLNQKKQYSDFLTANEKISTNILADRLVKLEAYGIITKEPYQTNPIRYNYKITARGKTLRPVLKSITKWGMENVSGTRIEE